MKKLLSVLLMVTCILGLTACGTEKEVVTYEEQEVQMLSEMLFAFTSADYDDAFISELKTLDEYESEQQEVGLRAQYGLKVPMETLIATIESWKSSKEDIGTSSGVASYDITADEENIFVKANIDGSLHEAIYEIVYDQKLAVQSVTISVQYSMGELMGKAALNTLLGMGTVFSVLILISLIISCFTFIPKMQAAFSKKSKQEEIKTDKSVNHTIAQIIEKEESESALELADDLELVAVISAAIAASAGAVSTEGFVVRSIRKSNRRN